MAQVFGPVPSIGGLDEALASSQLKSDSADEGLLPVTLPFILKNKHPKVGGIREDRAVNEKKSAQGSVRKN